MNDNAFLLATSIFTGVLFIAIAIPLILRRVPPNSWYGLRVPATFSDETVWYEANVRTAKDILMLGVIVIAVGVALYYTPIPLWSKVLVWSGIVVGGVIAVLIHGWRYANRLLRKQQATGREETA